MKRRLLLILFGSVACLALFWQAQLLAGKAARTGSFEQTAIETVLQDLLSHYDSPLVRWGDKKVLFYAPAGLDRTFRAEEVLRITHAQEWNALSHKQLEGANEAAAQLVQRVAAKRPLQELLLSDVRIKRHTRAHSKNLPFDPQVFSIYPPGYARDQQLALVHLSFTRGYHGGNATYLLERAGDRWTIRVRQFINYP